MRTDSSTHWSTHCKQWASALRSEYSARAKSAPATDASGCSSWPTARTARGGYTRDNGDPEKEPPTLDGLAAIWATPRATDGEKGGPNQSFGAGGTPLPAMAANWPTPSVMLTGERTSPETFAARQTRLKEKHRGRTGNGAGPDLAMVAKQWPTPAAQNWKGSSEGSIIRKDGKSRMDILCYAAEQNFPHSLPAPAIPAGQTSSPERRSLNPLFVEWLMGWPTGLSGFARAETGLCHWLRRMRGCLSALASRRTAPNGQETLL